jgi:hypothetical protein
MTSYLAPFGKDQPLHPSAEAGLGYRLKLLNVREDQRRMRLTGRILR